MDNEIEKVYKKYFEKLNKFNKINQDFIIKYNSKTFKFPIEKQDMVIDEMIIIFTIKEEYEKCNKLKKYQNTLIKQKIDKILK